LIIIYSKPNCPNCDIAKMQAMLRGVPFEEHCLDTQEKIASFLELYPGVRAVPFVTTKDGQRIGGLSSFKSFLHNLKDTS